MIKLLFWLGLFVFVAGVVVTLGVSLYLGLTQLRFNVAEKADEVFARVMERVTVYQPIFVEEPPAEIEATISKYARQYNVPENLVLAIARHENLKDRGNDARSSAGALGIMQVMPGYHVGAGKTCPFLRSWADLVGPKNIDENIHCGVRVIAACMRDASGIRRPQDYARKIVWCYNHDQKYVDSVVYSFLAAELGKV